LTSNSQKVKCYRYKDDWERQEAEFNTSEVGLIKTLLDINIIETGCAKLTSGGPAWNVLEVFETTAICIMPEEFDFAEVEFPLIALEDFDNGFNDEIDRILGIK